MMKRVAIAAAVLTIGAAGCGSNGTGTNPSNIKVFTVQMTAQNEVPPIPNAESTARGTAVLTFNTEANTIDFNVSLSGFTPTSAITIAHIHPGAAGTTGGVLVSTGLSPGTVVLTNGAGTFSFPGVGVSAATMQQILAAPQNFYFNVHTSLNGTGAIRGQLQ
ncbi:MAG TPA: CHRD domain-containing protein [Vicinamibacterales bacterium]|nr:CHRD domain-containing protein [Vicinamibacterales bacterium]